MDVHDRRQLYSGFSDSLVWAVEFAVTPVLFGFIGHFLDRWLGTGPWLTIALVLFAIAGLAVRSYYGYVAAMEAHEAAAPWAMPPSKQPLAGELHGGSGTRALPGQEP
ncbi:MAG TPA: AtpZ/AtpI family protein [Chloroflexota bacterium]|nr:AtpZ/AtpI family protein [Chloroflexota bacterium]